MNSFIVCADEYIYHFGYKNSDFILIGSLQCFTKVINMCSLLNPSQLIVCSRDPTIKIVDISSFEEEKNLYFKGH